MIKETKILIIGACGQIGTELTEALTHKYGTDNVLAADILDQPDGFDNYIQLNALDHAQIEKVIIDYKITQVYLLAAILSAKGEKNIETAWKLNVESLLSVLKIAAEQKLDKIFWPSSIAVFGPTSAKYNTRQHARAEPLTVYGISKKAGEYWCNYYFEKFGVDVRSLRYPGLVSYKTLPGGGTTDYAVDIFHQAIEKKAYTCFLEEDTCLPMMYLADAIRATLELMDVPKQDISIRTSYNVAGMSFAPCDLAATIQKHIPSFKMSYSPDYRQAIADSWPASIDDKQARDDWGWQPYYNLERMTGDMLAHMIPETPLMAE